MDINFWSLLVKFYSELDKQWPDMTSYWLDKSGGGQRGEGVLASKYVGGRSRVTELPCLYQFMKFYFK